MNRTLEILLLLSLALFSVACGRDESLPAPPEHEPHDHGAGAEVVHLAPAEAQELDIVLDTVGPGTIEESVDLPGEVALNTDRSAAVLARVTGIVVSAPRRAGDSVRQGEVLAIIESEDFAEAQASLLAAREREQLAEAVFQRETGLVAKGISAEQDLLTARRERAEARIELRRSRQALLALGLDAAAIDAIDEETLARGARFELRSPLSGTILEKSLALGEAVAPELLAFRIVNLETVWVDLRVYQRELPLLSTGQEVTISTAHEEEPARARIAFVRPIVDDSRRTALARVVLDNSTGHWHPGCFVTGRVEVGTIERPLTVAASALQESEEHGTMVFVVDGDAYAARPVTVGRRSATRVEIVSGLAAGERYVSRGSFALRAELEKGESAGGHVH